MKRPDYGWLWIAAYIAFGSILTFVAVLGLAGAL